MSHPSGVSTCTVTFGKAYAALGSEAKITGTIEIDRPVIHAASGGTYYAVPDDVESGAGGFFSTEVAHVNQAGFTDRAGNAVTNWAYVFKGQVDFGRNRIVNVRQEFQVVVGQDQVDLDLVPSGSITPGVSAPTPAVLSVAGLTGPITAADLVAILAEGVERITQDVVDARSSQLASVEELFTATSLPATTVTVTATSIDLWTAPYKLRVVAVSVGASTAIAANNAAYWIVGLRRMRKTAGVVASALIAQKTTRVDSGEAVVGRSDWNFDGVVFDAANSILEKGDGLNLLWSIGAGAPTSWAQPFVTVRYEPVD